MNRSFDDKRRDVKRLVQAARDVTRDRAKLMDDLIASTGLTREGVELGFARHLELDPTDAEIDALVASAGDAERVLVILSSNVFVAPLRAIALARAASSTVVVRPSRREPHFARALVAAANDPGVTLEGDIDLGTLTGGEVHVYGRDATIDAVRAQVGERARVRGHGTGMGVAFVGASTDAERAGSLVARDVVAFNQRGCLSPRVVLVEGEARAAAFAEALDAALTAAAGRVPRGLVHDDERAEATSYVSTMAFAGTVFAREGSAVGLGPLGAPLLIPPAGRHVHVARVRSQDEARILLGDLARVVVAVGADEADGTPRVSIAPPHARVSALGEMQRPLFDGPVDRRPT